jgi:plasmid stabilization system protein ParE
VKPVTIHPRATSELESAADYYERQRRGLGKRFRKAFEAALGRLLHSPKMYGVEVDDIRACPLHRFPYTIYYAELQDRIWVIAVAHQHRRPEYWLRRLGDG